MPLCRQLHKEGKLTEAEAAFLADRKPKEEFYDLTADPHEIHNLAGVPEAASELQRHRQILDRWILETDDKGQYPESAESLLQVLYGWHDRCVNPEFDAVWRKYAGSLPHGTTRGRSR